MLRIRGSKPSGASYTNVVYRDKVGLISVSSLRRRLGRPLAAIGLEWADAPLALVGIHGSHRNHAHGRSPRVRLRANTSGDGVEIVVLDGHFAVWTFDKHVKGNW